MNMIAVHNYQAAEVDILEDILEKHIDDFQAFTKVILQLKKENYFNDYNCKNYCCTYFRFIH